MTSIDPVLLIFLIALLPLSATNTSPYGATKTLEGELNPLPMRIGVPEPPGIFVKVLLTLSATYTSLAETKNPPRELIPLYITTGSPVPPGNMKMLDAFAAYTSSSGRPDVGEGDFEGFSEEEGETEGVPEGNDDEDEGVTDGVADDVEGFHETDGDIVEDAEPAGQETYCCGCAAFLE